jgi:hypothetical protein
MQLQSSTKSRGVYFQGNDSDPAETSAASMRKVRILFRSPDGHAGQPKRAIAMAGPDGDPNEHRGS